MRGDQRRFAERLGVPQSFTPERADDARTRERQKALVCHKLFGEDNPLLHVGRYRLTGTLGCGGMGTVYEAVGPRSEQRIALKMLHRRGPAALYGLKREFRSLAELDHENLVRLYELAVDGDDAYFTMELVDGQDFVSYVRGECAPGEPVSDEPKLLSALQQLAAGVHALHAAGKLHRDLKPSNVLVSSAGRVVLLDFGLVHDAAGPIDEIAGTPAYMAPEQARGHASTESDWYSFGRILEQALHGRAPAHGANGKVELASLTPTYARLTVLLERLLHSDPARRPSEREVQHRLGGARPLALAFGLPREERSEPFVGRDRELAALSSALHESRSRAVLVVIRGDAGMGKSTLLRRFTRGALDPSVLVLHGRCYERESVPFKALDGAIDELSRYFLTAPHELPHLGDEQRGALLQIFPVLGRVPALAAPYSSEPCHPALLRERGFAALNALLAALARRHALVLCIDDLQWSDADSGQLLAALLGDRTAARLLIIGCERGDPTLGSPALDALRAQPRDVLQRVELALDPLPTGDALALCASITAQLSTQLETDERERLHARIAREARGNPRFLVELSRAALRDPSAFARADGRVSLDALVIERVERLPPPTRACLELIAIAGRPVSLALIADALEVERDLRSRVEELRRARLVRTVAREGEDLLEVEHDQVGEVILKRLETGARQAAHARFARAVERSKSADVEALVEQYIAAGMPAAAALHARRAGDLALATLAFARAAWFYRQALDHGTFRPSERASLSSDLARALEHSGRGLEAAEAHRQAAAGASSAPAAARHLQRAAELLMNSGRKRQGEQVLARCYALHGFTWPSTRVQLWLEIARRLLLANLWQRAPRGSDDALHRERAEFLDANGPCLEAWDLARALYNSLLALDEAERIDDPEWRARARALRGLMRCVGLLRGGVARGLADMQAARSAVADLGDANIEAKLDAPVAFAYLLAGDARRALAHAEAFEARIGLMQSAPSVLCSALGLIGLALYELGELRECAARFRSLKHEAQRRGDAVAGFWVHVHPVQLALLFAAGDRSGAQSLLGRQRALIAEHPEFTLLAWAHALCSIETELYFGSARAAAALVETHFALLAKADLGLGSFRELAMMLRARTSLAAAQETTGRARRRLLRRALDDARALEHVQRASGRGEAQLMLAGVFLLQGDRERARQHLARSLDILDGVHNKLVAACARFGLARLDEGASSRELERAACATLHGEGIEQPEQWVGWCAPAFRSLLAGAH